MPVVPDRKDGLARSAEILPQEIRADFPKGAKAKLEQASGTENLSGYETRNHGDVLSGMYFDGEDGKPAWGTYGVLQELPKGVSKAEVVDFLVQGRHLELVKKLSPELPQAQKDGLEHMPGWRRKLAPEAAAEHPAPIVPKVDQAATQPDAGMALAQTPEAGGGAPVALGNLNAIEASRTGPGAPLEQLKKMIAGNSGHVKASALAEQLHKQARQTPESKV